MTDVLGIAASGMRLGEAMLAAAAANTANMHTPDYERAAVQGREAPGGGVEPVVVADPGGGLADDLVTAILAKHTVSLNVAMLRRADDAAQALIDLLV